MPSTRSPYYPQAMLEFAREQWLWLFALVGVFYVAWWFARRYRRRRVTYGRVWERVAKKVLPPGWKRILRTILTLFISGVLLSSVVLYAAGLQRPSGDQPAPLLIFIVLDNGPAVRVRDSAGTTRAELANARAQEIVDALGENDRALLAWRKDGRLLTGRWLKRGDETGNPPPLDWPHLTNENWPTDLSGIQAPPGLPTEPAPIRVAVQIASRGGEADALGRSAAPADADARLARAFPGWSGTFGMPTCFENVGGAGSNNGFDTAEYIRPEPGDGSSGRIRFHTLVPGTVSATDMTLNHPLPVQDDEVILPIQGSPLSPRLSLTRADSLPEDNMLGMRLQARQLTKVVLCYPPDDAGPNPVLRNTLAYFLPGREIETHAVQPGDDIKADLIVCDRAMPRHFDARYLLLFGVAPDGTAGLGPPLDVRPGMQLPLKAPDDLGFEMPQLTLLHGKDVVPLTETSMTPLAKDMSGGTLVAIQRGEPEMLYIGFLPHKSTLLLDTAGFLLLLRWLNAIQADKPVVFPPFVPRGAEVEVQLDQQRELQIRLAADNPWQPGYGPKEFSLTTAADGRGLMGPFEIPGEYLVESGKREIASFTVVWACDVDFNAGESAKLDLDKLFADTTQPDWRDYLPGALLWIALGALLLEWLLWLVGVTE